MSIDSALHTLRVVNELKAITLTSQDVMRIEKILREKGLANFIARNNTPGAELLEDYLKRFWDYDSSPYVKEKLTHKINITRKHTKESLGRVIKYWVPYFQGKLVGEITRQDINDFATDLAEKHPDYSPLTLKQIRRVGVTALKWAYANDIIPTDPTLRLPAYSSKGKKRGVLSPQEAADLFSLDWNDYRYFLINLVAMTTGLRISEILSLKLENVREKYLYVESSFSLIDGRKTTKNGEERTLPIIPQVRDALRYVASQNPHNDGYIFYSKKYGKPVDQHEPLKALKKMLVKLYIRANLGEISEDTTEKEKKALSKKLASEAADYWKARNVVFHSWRHFYSARMANKVDIRKLMLATGHKTEAIAEGYADHALENDLADVTVATNEVFGKLLPEKMLQENRTA
ncbi:site-specific integrase [Treponema sp. TIM-1]|uniref:tyrosine-type recombinase/integrase n=1 Tax=Treponema sp. TIM-1 TaxID=2898417 RepID=UPI00398185B8